MERKLMGLLLAMLGLMFRASAAAATLAGTVIGVSGSSTDHDHVLNRGDAVQIGDTLDVPADGNLKLQMADGSVISVAPGSSMTLASYSIGGSGRDVRLSLSQGMLRARVTSVAGPSTFEVSTAGGTASVSSNSADWFIKALPDSAQVAVLAGIIDLMSTATGESVSIPAHWGTRLETGLDPVLPRVWAQAEFNAVIRLTGAEDWSEHNGLSGTNALPSQTTLSEGAMRLRLLLAREGHHPRTERGAEGQALATTRPDNILSTL